MTNINRDYLVVLDVKTGEVDSPNIYYFNTDKNTSNFYVQMIIRETSIEATPIENATDYSIKANILKPNMVGKEVEGTLVNEEKAIYEFKLPADCTDFSGNAKIEFEVYTGDKIVTSFATKFKVYGSVLTEQNKYIEDSSDYPILKELIEEVRELQANGGGGGTGTGSSGHTHSNKTVLDGITAIKINSWDTAYTHSQSTHFNGNYNNLTDKPIIPTNTSQLINDSGFITEGSIDFNFIDDTTTATNKTWSSNKIDSQIKDIINNGIGITFEYITEEVGGISCTDITLNVTTLIFTSSGTQTIIATLTPSDTTDTLTYSSNNKNVATVTNNGVVTAIGNGDCTITIACGSITKTISVSVSGMSETVAVTGITVLPTTATINVNDTVTLTATIEPSNASNQNITWSSDNPTVAQVADGIVTGMAQGTASIGVATEDGGYSATCNVTVNAKINTYVNLFDKDTMITSETKGINGSGIIGTFDWGLATVPVQANTQYSLKMCETNVSGEVGYYSGPIAGAIGFADSTGTTLLSYLSLGNPTNTGAGVNADLKEYAHGEVTGYGSNYKGVEWITFTTPSDCCYLLFNTKLKNNADKIQLEQGDTIHDYYLAYNGGDN